MKVVNELLTPVNLIKPENSEKDRRQQHGKYQKITAQPAENEQDNEKIVGTTDANWDRIERRSGKDRRQQQVNRGRWLESRDKKDRRKTAQAFCLTI